jgi:hypothetical protein
MLVISVIKNGVAPMVKAIGITGKFYFNLDGNVGVGVQNNRDDTQLVQMGYFALARAQLSVPEDLKAIAMTVVPGAIYHGAEDDPLTKAIRLHEKRKGGTQDGRVSKMLDEAHASYAPQQRHIILVLCEAIGRLMPDIYPRIDKHPKCPPLLAEQVGLICNLRKDVFVP